MKKTLLTGIAALFLVTGTAHANDQLPEAMLGRWCQAGVRSDIRMIYYRPSFAGREHCVDFDDGITLSQSGFSDDRPIDQCDEYVFDKKEQTQDGFVISTHCEKAGSEYDFTKDDLAGTWHLQIVHDDLLIATKMSEG